MIDYMQKFHLDNKTAFVVGGLGLIGREVSIAYTMAGAKTIVLDINNDEGKSFVMGLNEKDYDITFKLFNCADIKKLDHSFSELLDQFGCPDIIINCSYPRTENWGESSFKNITLDSFSRNVDIHLKSYAWLARITAETMVKEGKVGSIIQLGSIYGILGQDLSVYEGTDMQENMPYSVIKGGITNLTRQMASYYGRYRIRVNTLCPGGISDDKQNKKFVVQYRKKVPLGRMGKAEEVATAALFLASDAASYITGATLMVDGGWTAI